MKKIAGIFFNSDTKNMLLTINLIINQCDFKFIKEVINSNIRQSTKTVTDKEDTRKSSSFLSLSHMLDRVLLSSGHFE